MDSFGMILSGILLIGLTIMAVNIYNGFVSLRNQVERAWSNIDVILKQRFDEIPQLIKVIEQYAGYEAQVIQKLTEARAHYGTAASVPEKISASGEMSLALRGVMAVGEAYPDLKSNQNFMQLQSRVSGLEEQIADRREGYNEAVANFNTRLEQFPDMIFANFLNYKRQTLFQVSEEEKSAPNLNMNLPKFGRGA